MHQLQSSIKTIDNALSDQSQRLGLVRILDEQKRMLHEDENLPPEQIAELYMDFEEALLAKFLEILDAEEVSERIVPWAAGRLLERIKLISIEDINGYSPEHLTEYEDWKLEAMKGENSRLQRPKNYSEGELIDWPVPEIYKNKVHINTEIVGTDPAANYVESITLDRVVGYLRMMGGTHSFNSKVKGGPNVIRLVPDRNKEALNDTEYTVMSYSEFISIVNENKAYAVPYRIDEYIREMELMEPDNIETEKSPSTSRKIKGLEAAFVWDYNVRIRSLNLGPRMTAAFKKEVAKLFADVADFYESPLTGNREKIYKLQF